MVDEVLQQRPAPTKHPCTSNFSRLEGQKQRANSGEVVRLSSGKVRARLAPEGDEQVAPLMVPVASPVRVQGRARRGQGRARGRGLMGAALL
jgi:hypothetical protein